MIRNLFAHVNDQKGMPGYTVTVRFNDANHKHIEGKLLDHGDDWLLLDCGTDRDIPCFVPLHAIAAIQINW